MSRSGKYVDRCNCSQQFFLGRDAQSTQSKLKQAQQEFQRLGQDLQAGNLASTQTDLTALQKDLPGVQGASPSTTRLIAGPVQQVVLVAKRVAAWDLTHEDLVVHAEDEIGELARSINEMQANLREMIGSVSASIERIATASEQFSANAASQAPFFPIY